MRAFYDLAFNQKQPEEAVARYVGSKYIQHNPMAGDDPGPFVEFVKADIFRLENGKVVEHWDVLQPVRETAANDSTMF